MLTRRSLALGIGSISSPPYSSALLADRCFLPPLLAKSLLARLGLHTSVVPAAAAMAENDAGISGDPCLCCFPDLLAVSFAESASWWICSRPGIPRSSSLGVSDGPIRWKVTRMSNCRASFLRYVHWCLGRFYCMALFRLWSWECYFKREIQLSAVYLVMWGWIGKLWFPIGFLWFKDRSVSWNMGSSKSEFSLSVVLDCLDPPWHGDILGVSLHLCCCWVWTLSQSVFVSFNSVIFSRFFTLLWVQSEVVVVWICLTSNEWYVLALRRVFGAVLRPWKRYSDCWICKYGHGAPCLMHFESRDDKKAIHAVNVTMNGCCMEEKGYWRGTGSVQRLYVLWFSN